MPGDKTDLPTRYKSALEALTPGGSEFHDSPETCAEFVRDRLSFTVQQQKRIVELVKALEWALNRIPKPELVRGQNDTHCANYAQAEAAIQSAEGGAECPKSKVSKAARELANAILEAARPKVTGDFKQDAEAWPSQGLDVKDMAGMVDSALAELLEKAGGLLCVFGSPAPSHGCACNNCDFAKALEPWQS